MPAKPVIDLMALVQELDAPIHRAGPHTAARRRRMLEAHRAAIAARMRQLEETADVLDGKIAQYREMENL